MDNASKALIMAGAILISIAIVGVGVYIFSTTSSVSDSVGASMDAYAANQLNSQLRAYEGKKIKGSTVKDFLALVESFNSNNAFPDDITAGGGSVSTIANNEFYTISLGVSANGYINNYVITHE